MTFPEFACHFSILKDPRVDRTKKHSLLEIIFIGLCTVMAGGEGWEDMQSFGLARQDWFREHMGMQLAHGIPCDDTFRRLFSRLDPAVLSQCLISWMSSLQQDVKGEVIAIDGKTLRHSFDKATGQKAIHLVSAWATQRGFALGQVKVDDKSNEITAIPALIDTMDIKGCVITIDAMGCQTAIAEKIIDKKGDYVLALKGNQSSLHEDVKLFFEDARQNKFYEKNAERRIPYAYHEALEKDHGRFEKRKCWVVSGGAIGWLTQKGEWKKLNSICAVECHRHIGERESVETRYFISSLDKDAEHIATVVRAHWAIENSLHWVLDVSLKEDACGIWKDHGSENLATLRRVATGLLRSEKTSKVGIKARSKRVGWEPDYLLKVLFH